MQLFVNEPLLPLAGEGRDEGGGAGMRPRPDLPRTRARSLRRGQTDAEAALWRLLRGRGLDVFKFRRQHPVGPYVLDFFCAERHLAIELDGAGHTETCQVQHDQRRDEYLRRAGIRVLRYWNDQLWDEQQSVLEDIWRHLQQPNPHPHPVLLPQAGEGA